MTNKIIEAARKAQIYANPWAENDATWPVDKHDLARFYAIARAEALEDAAKVAEEWKTDWAHCLDVAEAIRKLKEKQHG